MSKHEALPHFGELLVLWSVHMFAISMAFYKEHLGAIAFGTIGVALLSFLTGARIERYRAQLVHDLEKTDDD